MTLKEFLEKYVWLSDYVTVFRTRDDSLYADTLIYLARAATILRDDIWSRFLDYEVVRVASISQGLSLMIEVKGE